MLCNNVIAFYSLVLNKTVQNRLWKGLPCTKLIYVRMKNNQSHKSGENIKLYNTAMKGFLL